MKEIWVNIEGVARNYQVSNMGRVRNIRPIKFAEEGITYCNGKSKNKGGSYRAVCRLLLDNGMEWKTFQVHKLVARAFVPNPNNYNVVVHKNGNMLDNRAKNLAWAKKQETGVQLQRVRNIKKVREEIDHNAIYCEYKYGMSAQEIAKKYKVSVDLIEKIITNKNKENKQKRNEVIIQAYNDGMTQADISRKFNISPSLVCKVLKGER